MHHCRLTVASEQVVATVSVRAVAASAQLRYIHHQQQQQSNNRRITDSFAVHCITEAR
jgi:hypothetical protein